MVVFFDNNLSHVLSLPSSITEYERNQAATTHASPHINIHNAETEHNHTNLAAATDDKSSDLHIDAELLAGLSRSSSELRSSGAPLSVSANIEQEDRPLFGRIQ